MKITVDEFLEEMEFELSCYEGIDEKEVQAYKDGFHTWAKSDAGIKNIGKNPDSLSFSDENDMFSLADSYVLAVIEDEREKYWNQFKVR